MQTSPSAPVDRRRMRKADSRQRGVAVVTALLLTTLAVTLVASVFWQQQVQARSLENQRLQSQTQWVLRAALDWTRIILREDARTTKVDHLGEAWAAPMVETPLDDYLENDKSGGEAPGATLSGNIVDAQSRYNLGNLAQAGVLNPQEVAVFQRLLRSLNLDPGLAQSTAAAIAAAQAAGAGNGPNGSPSAIPPDGKQAEPAQLIHVEDLIAIPGYTTAALGKLNDYVVILPAPAPINVNTAGALVLAAKMNLPMEAATALVADRNHAYFVDIADFQNRAHSETALADTDFAVKTNFFLVYSCVRLERANVQMQTLIYRKGTGNTTILWLRES